MLGSKSAEIAELQTKVTDLTAAKTQLETDNGKLKADLEAANTERDTANTNLATEKARADKATADLAEANKNHETALKAANDKHAADLRAAQEAHEAKVNAEVTSRLAAAGAPIEVDPKAKQQGDPGSTAPPPSGLTGLAKSRAALAQQAVNQRPGK